jgi:hypothetical protein
MLPLFRRSQKSSVRTAGPAIESLESRAYMSVVPATVAVTVPGPVPAQVLAGVKVKDKIAVNLANNDVIPARGRFTLTLFASTDQALSVDDAQIFTANESINVAVGRSHTYKINVKAFPQNLVGNYFILAKVGGAAVNPAVGSSVTAVSIQQPQIDLAGLVTQTPLTAHVGHKFPISIKVTNNGNTAAKGPLTISLGLSQSPDGSSPASLATLSKRISLKPGASQVLRFNVALPLGVLTGNGYLVADVDPANAYLDPNLANNVSVGQQPVSVT